MPLFQHRMLEFIFKINHIKKTFLFHYIFFSKFHTSEADIEGTNKKKKEN